MNEKHFKKESSDQAIRSEAIEVFNSVLEGEGSEGLQALEELDAHSYEFIGNLQLLHMGEGESLESVARDVEESAGSTMSAIVDALDGETPEERLYSAAIIIRDLDRRAQEKVGEENAVFSKLDDEEVIDNIVSAVEDAVNQANPEDDDQIYEYTNNGIDSVITQWGNGIVSNTAQTAEQNFNDQVREKRQERKDKIKKFARDAGAVALGSLPIVGALLYKEFKRK